MINLFVTYRCNLACPYCFARDLQSEFPEDMAQDRFEAALDWLVRTGEHAVAFIGGEPTLHPRLTDMVRQAAEAGLSPVLFTNGLCKPDLVRQLAPRLSNVVVNYNDPDMLTPGQREQLHITLSLFRDAGTRITLSKNFSNAYAEYGYLLDALERYGVKAVRYDISRPSPSGANDHFTLDRTRDILAHVTGFVRECETRAVPTGLDCCVRLCDTDPADRRYMENVSIKWSGICHPSVDVHPDLSASYCLPMRHICAEDLTAFAGRDELMRWFADAVRPLRSVAAEDCAGCADFMRRCQGGCLALKTIGRAGPPRQQPPGATSI